VAAAVGREQVVVWAWPAMWRKAKGRHKDKLAFNIMGRGRVDITGGNLGRPVS